MSSDSLVRMQCPNCNAVVKGKPQQFANAVTCPKCSEKGRFVLVNDENPSLAKDQAASEDLPPHESENQPERKGLVNLVAQAKEHLVTDTDESVPEKLNRLIDPSETILCSIRPSKKVFHISAAIAGGISVLFGLLVLIAGMAGGRTFLGFLGLVAILVVGIVGVYASYLNWINTFYVITSARTILQRGIFNVNIVVIPNNNIQVITIDTGFIDRILDFNSITLSTAASGGIPFIGGGPTKLMYLEDVDSVVKTYGRHFLH